MSKPARQYLGISFLISYLCFGAAAYTRLAFSALLQRPLMVLLLFAGSLGPLVAALVIFSRNEEYDGLGDLLSRIKTVGNPRGWKLVAFFLVLHYGLAMLLRTVEPAANLLQLLAYLPLMLLVFGSQELGWRLVLQPELERNRGFWKASAAVGLLWALWFLPLLMIPGFVIRPDFFIQFAAYLVGVGVLLATLQKQSEGILPCVLFSTLFFALTVCFPLRQGNMIVLLAVADFVIAMTYQSRLFIERERKNI